VSVGRAPGLAAAVWLVASCEGQSPSQVPTEPIQVSGGQFISGPLPGKPPPDGGANPTGALAVTQLNTPVLPLVAGAVTALVTGEVTTDASAVGIALADLGSGYWVVPLGSTDPLTGDYTFSFSMSLNPADPSGVHRLRVVGLGPADKDGHVPAGQANDARICIQSPVPDNGHACNPAKTPPPAVISLQWDTAFDLDLHVTLPDGTDLNPKSSVGQIVDGGTSALAFDRDSWGACVPDGFYQEDLAFQAQPRPGTYSIRVDPFASCGAPVAHFTVTVYERMGTCPQCGLASVFSQAGELLATQVTGGASAGLFVHTQTF
jgi:hypothetical protein